MLREGHIVFALDGDAHARIDRTQPADRTEDQGEGWQDLVLREVERKNPRTSSGRRRSSRRPPSGRSFSRKPTKKSNKTPNSTGGTPVSRTNGGRKRAQPLRRPRPRGDRAEEISDDKTEDRSDQQETIVHGNACTITPMAVVGYLLSE